MAPSSALSSVRKNSRKQECLYIHPKLSILILLIVPFSAADHKVYRNLQAVMKMWEGDRFSSESKKPSKFEIDTIEIFARLFLWCFLDF